MVFLSVAVAGGVVLTQDVSPGYRANSELATLIRTMGALKLATIFPLVFAAAWLRMDAPPMRRTLYVALALSSTLGIALILALSHVSVASAVFHLGFLGMLVHMSKDPGFVEKLRPLAKFWSK
ncbi:MAG: hypothetical protein AAF862_06180 [Pseudomonadota bacterium]